MKPQSPLIWVAVPARRAGPLRAGAPLCPARPAAWAGGRLAWASAFVLAVAAAWAGAGPAMAQSLDAGFATVPPATLAQALALVREAATAIAPASARVVVEPGVLDARLHLAACAQVQAYLPAGVPAWGRTRVGLRCTDGQARWNVSLPVQVRVLAAAVVAVSALPAGGTLTAAHLERVECDWALSPGGLLEDTQALVGRIVQRNITKGQAISASMLQPRLWFGLGETVRVEISGAGYAIVTEATALAPGLEGRPVRVQTEAGRVLIGRPVGLGRIEVML